MIAKKRNRTKAKKPIEQSCDYCGARVGEPCIVTLAPELGPLSVRWNHHAREVLV